MAVPAGSASLVCVWSGIARPSKGSLSLVSQPAVIERTEEIGGVSTHWREAPTSGGHPIVYLHGVPTASWQWLPFLERTGGIAPDLPGLGKSGRPTGFEYSIAGYDRWFEQFADALGLERFSLVVQDWGVVALPFAQRFARRRKTSSPVRRHRHSASTISSGIAIPISANTMWNPSDNAIWVRAAKRSDMQAM